MTIRYGEIDFYTNPITLDVANVQNSLYIIFEKNAFFYVLFNIIFSERAFCNVSYTIWMTIYENIQHSMDIYDEIFIL